MGYKNACIGLAAMALVASVLLFAGCAREGQSDGHTASAAADTAPPPPALPEHDPAASPVERAAPPTLQPVVLGKFEAGDPVAESATGALDIEDTRIDGANGASFVTERVALVSGDDQYSAGARYADAMMIEPRVPVELRRVLEQTPPTRTPADAFCGSAKTGWLALARIMDGDAQVVKLLALGGQELPAASATGVKLCAAAQYLDDGK